MPSHKLVDVSFTPSGGDCGALTVRERPDGEFEFIMTDVAGVVHVKTYHTSLPDALAQVVQRMRLDMHQLGPMIRIHYEVEVPE